MRFNGVSEQGRNGLLWTVFEGEPFQARRVASFSDEQECRQYLESVNAGQELERVKEALAVAQSQIDNNDATLAQVKLCHKSQLERVKGQRDELLAALKAEVQGRLGGLEAAVAWADQYRNDPKADQPLIQMVDAIASAAEANQ